MTMLIKHAIIYDMEGNPPYKGDIYIENGRIAQMGPALTVCADEVIEAEGLTALPGLVDAHSHLGGFNMVNVDECDFNEMTDPVTPDVRALDACNIHDQCFMDACKGGVTTMCVTPGSGNAICGLAFIAKTAGKTDIHDLVLRNPSALKLAFGMNPIGVYGSKNQAPMTRMGVIKVMRDAFNQAKIYMEKKEAADGDPLMMPEFNPKLEAISLALSHQIPLKIHCEQFDMLTAIELAKEFDCEYTIEHAWGSEFFLPELAAGGGAINYGPVGVPTGYGELTHASIAEVKMLEEAGLLVSIITDSPITMPELIYIQAGEAVRRGVAHENALKMITINPAKALHVDDRVGSLKIGKDGDVVLFTGMPAMDVAANVKYTIIEGKVVYKQGEGYGKCE
ncbi:MAG: amidohydrolase family protein [Clostridiales bacterium]|nr:amidohydrolase family protein [Clostridiales bacterium]MDD7143282.1 amidohydrolase family protein [bacterium]MDY5457625.1 amidohydrolase family protein [Bariatricus sp.]